MIGSIPSPPWSAWSVGPFTVHAYALCILAGIGIALVLSDRRWRARGGAPGDVEAIAAWAVPFGILGGRLYHVITDPELYFEPGRNPWNALAIWRGGLGIWGAVALGAVGAAIGARRRGVRLAPFADAIAPGIVLAQGIGRLGNWFNQELYGGPTTLPWAVHITHPSDGGAPGLYHPTFLYELIWDVSVAALLVMSDRGFRFGHGRLFALYVGAYSAGRLGVELLRTDHANHVLGLRLNVWTASVLIAASAGYLVVTRGRGREEPHEVRWLPDDAGRSAAVDAEPR